MLAVEDKMGGIWKLEEAFLNFFQENIILIQDWLHFRYLCSFLQKCTVRCGGLVLQPAAV